MKEIILVRHAESTANTGEYRPHLHGDHHLNLSDHGITQAGQLATRLNRDFLSSAMLYCSPYSRARMTMAIVRHQLDLEDTRVYKSVFLREQDRGYLSEKEQLALRKIHGWFWYRHAGGESPADVYLRVSLFLDALYRERDRSGRHTAFIVSHGMTIRCFVTRFLNLDVREFERMRNPQNCDIVRLVRSSAAKQPVFDNGSWAVEGIRLRSGQRNFMH